MSKKVLIITHPFYDIQKEFIKELEYLDYKLKLIGIPFVARAFKYKHFPFHLINYVKGKRAERKAIKSIQGQYFDCCLAIGVFFDSNKIIKELKKENPTLRTIIHFWDSFRVWDFSFAIDWFDKKYSFDFLDCEKYKTLCLVYNLNFYIDNTISLVVSSCPPPLSNTTIVNNRFVYDSCHIGTLNQFSISRLDILIKLKKQADLLGLKSYISIYFPKIKGIKNHILHWVQYVIVKKYRKLFQMVRKTKSNIITSKKLTLKQCTKIEKSSKCIIDIPIDFQTGYPIRTISAIALGQKLITTNNFITQEKFYNKNNISIIDKKNPIIDTNFLNSKSEPIDIKYLQLKNWLINLIEN